MRAKRSMRRDSAISEMAVNLRGLRRERMLRVQTLKVQGPGLSWMSPARIRRMTRVDDLILRIKNLRDMKYEEERYGEEI